MNFRLTMVLVIVLLMIASLFVWLRNHQPETPKPAETPQNLLVSPAPKDIRTLAYLRDGQVQVSFAKNVIADPAAAPKWTMTAPANAPAEGFMLNEIADSLRMLSYKEKFEPETTGTKSEESTGLKSPRNVIEYTDESGKKHTMSLGKRTVGGAYARLDSAKTIYLLDSNPLEKLDVDPAEFRSKMMAEVNPDKVSALTVTIAGQTVELSRPDGPEGKWVITKPIPARANAAVVEALLNEMRSIRAADFTSMTTDMPAVGLNPAAVTVTAFAAQASAATSAPASGPAGTPAKVLVPIATFSVGYFTDPVQKKQLYATLGQSKEVFTITADSYGHLNKTLNDLRDPAITPLAVADATEVSIVPTQPKDATQTVSLKNIAGQWTITNLPHPVHAGPMEIGTLLNAIKNLRAIKYVDGAGDLKSIGLDPPACTITLRLPMQSQSETLLIGKPETADKVTPVMRQGESTVYLVQTPDVDLVMGTMLTLRDKEMEHLTGDMVREISFAGPAAKAQSLSREGAKWKLTVDGKTSTADEVKIVSLLSTFTPITAAKWLATNADVPAGAPDATVTLSVLDLSSSAATSPATMPAQSMGPVLPSPRTIKMWKKTQGPITSWVAVYEGGPEPAWTFVPSSQLLDAMTHGDFTPAATQPATMPAAPATPAEPAMPFGH